MQGSENTESRRNILDVSIRFQAKDLLFVLNPMGETLYIDPGIEQISQFKVEEWMALPQAAKYTPESIARAESQFRAGFRLASQGGEVGLRNYSNLLHMFLIRKDGSLREIELHYGFWFEEGQVQGIIGHLRDFTSFKRHFVPAEDAQHLWHSFSDLIQDGLMLLDASLAIRFVNASACRILGFTEKSLEGKSIADVLLNGNRTHPVWKKLQKRQLLRSEQIALTHPEGFTVWLQLNANPYLPSGANEQHLLLSFSDLSKLLEQQRALDAANKAKDKLFSLISHDLRGPFQQVSQVVQLLQDKVISPDELQGLLQQILPKLQRSQLLVDNLLDWSRSQWKNQIPVYKRLVVLDVWNEAVDWVKSDAEAKDIQFEIEFPNHLEIRTDQNMAVTIVRNLLSNAIKFSFPKGLVRFRVHAMAEGMVLECADHGIGMEPEHLQNILRRTHALSPSFGTSNEKGSGIGLQLCMDFAERMEGRLEIESVVGKGTTARLILPNLVYGDP